MTYTELRQTIANYEKIRPHITVTFRPEGYRADVSAPADIYGFPGLIIVPRIHLIFEEHFATCWVTPELMEIWGISRTQLISDAIENLNPQIMPMGGLLTELTAMPEEDINALEDFEMYVVTNKNRYEGAACILKSRARLHKLFPDGYVMIPSSIHEMIVIKGNPGDIPGLSEMVRYMNSTDVLSQEEILSNRAYAA